MLPIIAIIIVTIAIVAVAGVYTNLVALRNHIDNEWRTIDAQLQRLTELVPGLVGTARGGAAVERPQINAVTDALMDEMSASAPADRVRAARPLTRALDDLMDTAKAHPDLADDASFLQLCVSIKDATNRGAAACRTYNECVRTYNEAIKVFPGSLFAGVFQFKERAPFEEQDAA